MAMIASDPIMPIMPSGMLAKITIKAWRFWKNRHIPPELDAA
jgi:hypothetical protein